MKSRNERSIIDCVLVNKRNRTDIKNVRIRRGAELYRDHYLLRTKIRMKSTREGESTHTRGEKQKITTSIKSHKLGEREIAEKFKERTEEKIYAWMNTATDASATTEELRKTFEDLVLSTAKETWYKNRRWTQKNERVGGM